MKKRPLHWLALSALTTLWLGIPAGAQSVPGQTTTPVRDNDTTRQELSQFDQFLDSHREIAEQIRKNPSLVNDQAFVKNHPALQTYLQDHPAVREEIKENPDAFMHKEARYDRHEDNRGRDITHMRLSRFDQFLDSHREIAEQIRKNPSLVNNKEFVKNHPALQTYLQNNPGVSEEIKENPSDFMQKEARYDRSEANLDRDTSHLQLSHFDQFLDSHREIAQQLRKDPSLANNQQFLKDHPDLQNYLQDHPEIRQGLQENPSAFMQRETRHDRTTESATDRDANRIDRDAKHTMDRDANRAADRDVNHTDRDVNHTTDRDANHTTDRNADRTDRDANHRTDRDTNHTDRDASRMDRDAKHTMDRDANRAADLNHADRDVNHTTDRDANHTTDRNANHKSFGEFLGGHSNVAQQLSKDPSLVKNQEYMENHPELKSYLNAHPDVRQQLIANPQSFVKSAQQYSHNNGQAATTTTADPKIKH